MPGSSSAVGVRELRAQRHRAGGLVDRDLVNCSVPSSRIARAVVELQLDVRGGLAGLDVSAPSARRSASTSLLDWFMST